MFELIYCSAARPGIHADDISAILKTSREFNKNNSITGCLLYHDGEFIQLLEGEESTVQTLYSNIVRDQRHNYLQLVVEETVPERAFDNWSMAFHDLSAARVSPITKSLFIENIMAFSDLAAKPSAATELFWYMARQMVNTDWTGQGS